MNIYIYIRILIPAMAIPMRKESDPPIPPAGFHGQLWGYVCSHNERITELVVSSWNPILGPLGLNCTIAPGCTPSEPSKVGIQVFPQQPATEYSNIQCVAATENKPKKT